MSKVCIHEDFLWRLFARNNPALPPRRKARTARRWAETAHRIAEYLRYFPTQKAAELRRWAGTVLLSERRWEKLPPGYESPFGRDAMAVKARPGVEDHALRILAEVVVDIYYFHGHAPTGENEPHIVRWDEYSRAPYPVPTRRQYDAWRAVFPLTASGHPEMASEWALIYEPGAYFVYLRAPGMPQSDLLAHLPQEGGKVRFAGGEWTAEIVEEIFDDFDDTEWVRLVRPFDAALIPVEDAVRAAQSLVRELDQEILMKVNLKEECDRLHVGPALTRVK